MKYNIITSSRYHFVLTLIISFSLLGIIFKNPLKSKTGTIYELLIVLAIMALGLFTWYLTKYTSKGKILITFEEEGLRISWIKNYLLYKYRDRFYRWDDIESYKFMPDRWFDIFTIYSLDHRSFVFEHDSSKDGDDDFRDFYNDFQRKIISLNKNNSTVNKIKKISTIYDGNSGKVFSIIAILILIGGLLAIILSLIKGLNNYSNIIGLIGAMGGAIFTIIIIKKMKK